MKFLIPIGVVRKINDLLPLFGIHKNRTAVRNICYVIQFLDFLNWMLKTFHIYGPVLSYIHKTGIIFANMILEQLTYDYLKQKKIQPHQKYSKNIDKLEKYGVSKSHCQKMRSLNKRRSNIHLRLVTDLEYNKYSDQDWDRSFVCLDETLAIFKYELEKN